MRNRKLISTLLALSGLLPSGSLFANSFGLTQGKLDYTPQLDENTRNDLRSLDGVKYFASGIFVDASSYKGSSAKPCSLQGDIYFLTSARPFKNLPPRKGTYQVKLYWDASNFSDEVRKKYDTGTIRGFTNLDAQLVEKEYFDNLALLKIVNTRQLDQFQVNGQLVYPYCAGLSNTTNSPTNVVGYAFADFSPRVYPLSYNDVGLEGGLLTTEDQSKVYGVRVSDYDSPYIANPTKKISASQIKSFLDRILSGNSRDREMLNRRGNLVFNSVTDELQLAIRAMGSRSKPYSFTELTPQEFEYQYGEKYRVKVADSFFPTVPSLKKIKSMTMSGLKLKDYVPDSRYEALLYQVEGVFPKTKAELSAHVMGRDRQHSDFSYMVIGIVNKSTRELENLDLVGDPSSSAHAVGNMRYEHYKMLNQYSKQIDSAPNEVKEALSRISTAVDEIFVSYIQYITQKTQNEQKSYPDRNLEKTITENFGKVVSQNFTHIAKATEPFYDKSLSQGMDLFLGLLTNLSRLDQHLRNQSTFLRNGNYIDIDEIRNRLENQRKEQMGLQNSKYQKFSN